MGLLRTAYAKLFLYDPYAGTWRMIVMFCEPLYC